MGFDTSYIRGIRRIRLLSVWLKQKKRKVNEVRHQMFQRKYDNENKIVDLSSLPPWKSVLKLHTSRAHFVAKVWKSADDHQLEFPHLPAHGWTPGWVLHYPVIRGCAPVLG